MSEIPSLEFKIIPEDSELSTRGRKRGPEVIKRVEREAQEVLLFLLDLPQPKLDYKPRLENFKRQKESSLLKELPRQGKQPKGKGVDPPLLQFHQMLWMKISQLKIGRNNLSRRRSMTDHGALLEIH